MLLANDGKKHNFTITLKYGMDIYLQFLDHGGKSCQKSSK